MPAPPAAWVYVLVVLGLVGGGLLLCVLLFRFHAGQRRQRNQAIKTYYAEQERYRDEIADMHDAAKESVADFASLRSSSSYFAASPPATVAERERERERPTPGPSNLRNLAAAAAASGDLDAGLGLSTSSRTIQQTETRDPAAAGTGTAPAQAPTSNARESQAWRTSLLDFYERPETRARARAESQHEGTEEDEEEEDDVSDRTSEPAQNGLVPSSSQPRRGQNAGWAF